MNDFEQDLARTDHLLSDLAATMYELVQDWADEQLEWLDSLPPVQPITEDTLEEFSEEYKYQQLKKILAWEEEQLAWADSLPEFEPLDELPEPDDYNLPPAGTPLDILPPPYNRYDWWKFKMLEWAGQEVSHMLIYNMTKYWNNINSENCEFVPSYQSYLDMCQALDNKLEKVSNLGFSSRNGKLYTPQQMQKIIQYAKCNPSKHVSVYHCVKAIIMYSALINDGEEFSSTDLGIFPSVLVDFLVRDVADLIHHENQHIIGYQEQAV